MSEPTASEVNAIEWACRAHGHGRGKTYPLVGNRSRAGGVKRRNHFTRDTVTDAILDGRAPRQVFDSAPLMSCKGNAKSYVRRSNP